MIRVRLMDGTLVCYPQACCIKTPLDSPFCTLYAQSNYTEWVADIVYRNVLSIENPARGDVEVVLAPRAAHTKAHEELDKLLTALAEARGEKE